MGDPGTGTPDVSHIENEVVLSSLRWLKLDVPQAVTRGTWVEKPDLSRVDEIGWTHHPSLTLSATPGMLPSGRDRGASKASRGW